jgi:hypothetical protein
MVFWDSSALALKRLPGRSLRFSEHYRGDRRCQSKFQILGAAIEPLKSTWKNAGKSMAAKSGSDLLAM